MAKKNASSDAADDVGTSLATVSGGGGGLATAIDPSELAQFGDMVVAGRDESGSNLSRVAMYAGTPTEEKKYGRHDRGMFLDLLENRELGMSIDIMPVTMFATYAQWEQGQTSPLHTWNDRREVPPELLTWGKDASGKSMRPAVQETVNCVCIVRNAQGGVEPWPYLFQFKSTGLQAFEQGIKMLEARRRAKKMGPGLYTLSSRDDKNTAGQDYKRLVQKPSGDPPAEMVRLGLELLGNKAAIAAAQEAAAAEEFNPDAH